MKKSIKLIYVGIAFLCLNLDLNAQILPGAFGYYQDVLRFSQNQQIGSARFSALGGSGSVLGGDISSAFLNPAGLGFYNRSQFVLTPTLGNIRSNNLFFDETSNSETTRFGFANGGIVINFNKEDLVPGSWRGGSLAITYNQVNDFKQNIGYSGQNNTSSIIDAMLDRADGFFPEELGGIELIGYDHFLINPIPGAEDVYASFVEGFPRQSEVITRSGQIDQINVAFGGNFDDKIYIGAGVGFSSADYTQLRLFRENFNGNTLRDFSIDERLDISGSGVNANLGVIFRPTQFFRIGASVTTPTWYNFSEESDAIYLSRYNGYDVANFLDDNGNRLILEDTTLIDLQTASDVFFSDYDLRTPFRFNTGVAFFLGKNGFITADVEHLNYGDAHVNSMDFSAESDNRTIENIYQSVTNIRLGAEYRYDVFRLRMGYASIGDPTNDSLDGIDRSRQIISGGFGINMGQYFFDMSYSRTSFDDSFTSYTFVDGTGPSSLIDSRQSNIRLSIGLNF